ncbi:hypothetical protein PVK06_047202 [Gossypium arboreum]|uniref:Uncharacterized protein n=1 Tax=Gossypium arboreum TaxID=29729 RepID=A0ABR0MCQ7_GOSAR|nr:hypothetical protein PVK06_047202 [Gossypium arboreum]
MISYVALLYFATLTADEELKKEEEGDDKDHEEESTHNEDFNDVFRPKQPSIEGDKIRNPSYTGPTSSTGVRATTPVTG